MEPPEVTARLFEALQTVDVSELSKCEDSELRPVLASLVRMSLIASLDKSANCMRSRTGVLGILSRIELVNNLVALLSIDFHLLEVDVRKEMSLRCKAASLGGGGGNGCQSSVDSVLVTNLAIGPSLDFERSDASRRLRLVLSELISIMCQIQATAKDSSVDSNGPQSPSSFQPRSSELFDHLVYFSEVCDVLAIAMAELPNLLSPAEAAEALLRLKYGPHIICHVVANQPDSFVEVSSYLLKNGDKQEDDGSTKVRHEALMLLCKMNPSAVLSLRNRCIESCRMPSLAIMLTLELRCDVVAFVSGLLLGNDPQVRSWISFFVRSGQKKKNEALSALREVLLQRLRQLTEAMNAGPAPSQSVVVKSASILRLYTALRGIAGLKFTEDEVAHLVELITSKPPVTAAGVKLVSIGLCMLIACNSLLTTSSSTSPSSSASSASSSMEKRAVEWIHWLVKEERTFERSLQTSASASSSSVGGVASFAEILLLMAIHFHSNQLNAIGDLVCQTLGMKVAIRANSVNRIRHIFTHEVFTDQVVAAHAARVPVTRGLSADLAGFLPVHCVHQLLRSRAFTKHKVPIKDWIFRQLCVSALPLHPVLPALVEVYVNSVLVPAPTRSGTTGSSLTSGLDHDLTNEPISEQEVRAVFRRWWSSSSSYSQGNDDGQFGAATQILMLYYVLLYENTRLAQMRNIVLSGRKVLRYSSELMADLPIKLLLKTAEQDQALFGYVFPQLLRLCATHFPHLCLVQDWVASEEDKDSTSSGDPGRLPSSTNATVGQRGPRLAERTVQVLPASSASPSTLAKVQEALVDLKACPPKLTLVLRRLLKMEPNRTWQYADLIVSHVADFLEDSTPLQLIELFSKFWFMANTVYPRRLWTTTVNHLNHVNCNGVQANVRKRITQDDLVLDPLQVLRCDRRVFRCAPILEIVLYIVKACLAASRTHLAKHIQDNPIVGVADRGMGSSSAQVSNDMEREELKNALVATQESAAIQIILEAGLMESGGETCSNVKGIRLICSYLHEAFIADPNLAKLVHFQGYPLELLPVTVAGVPSMHICLDFCPELLSQPDLEKQAFAVDLISHLSVQYALPKSYSIARLAINALSTLLSVLTSEERGVLFPPILPSLVRICKAFPTLIEDSIGLLLQFGRISVSEACVAAVGGYSGGVRPEKGLGWLGCGDGQLQRGLAAVDAVNDRKELQLIHDLLSPRNESLASMIHKTFSDILENSVLEKRLY